VISTVSLGSETGVRLWLLLCLLLSPEVISSLVGAFLVFLFWIAAMSKFELSHTYPFNSLSFVIVLGLNAIFFHEAITVHKVLGVLFIISGLIIGSSG